MRPMLSQRTACGGRAGHRVQGGTRTSSASRARLDVAGCFWAASALTAGSDNEPDAGHPIADEPADPLLDRATCR